MSRPESSPAAALSPEAEAQIRAFIRRNFGLRGTLSLHRHALGWDLLRAPANVLLAGLAFVVRVTIWLLHRLGARRAGEGLGRIRLAFPTAVAREIDRRLRDELLAPLGLLPEEAALRSYAEIRAATGEMTATAGTLGTGAAFKTLTPGVISLAPLIAGIIAQSAAIAAFPLGGMLGAWWYGVFPPRPDAQLIAICVVALMSCFALVSTFAGLVADPLQALLGIHRWRLRRLVRALSAPGGRMPAPEHGMARAGDLADMAVNLKRFLGL
ncbi:DUF6635 family protein [Mangrovicoccus algicola]|uniref:Uncharacterized protein n=1 Tax=Mangrovicoccus algicola TaxID=2771008 RepID=A0A8J7CI05_9RHOB|nr:DUF6635 family protein [Mangrovicoccus algicola]MBE3638970.1 hypothetical protein [Mangrovicoccus algicola]